MFSSKYVKTLNIQYILKTLALYKTFVVQTAGKTIFYSKFQRPPPPPERSLFVFTIKKYYQTFNEYVNAG